MNEEVPDEGTETPDDSSIENEDTANNDVAPDKRDQQIANLNKALNQEREQNKRLKDAMTPPPSVQPNEDGSIDPNAFAQSVNAQTQQTVDSAIKDEREWNKAAKKYPDIENDQDIEDAVRGMKAAALINRGEILTYEEAADRVLGKVKKTTEKAVEKAKEDGRTEAQVSERIQERANIDSPSGGKEDPEATKKAEIRKILYSPDSTDEERAAAREKLLSF